MTIMPIKDLIILLADKDIEFTIKGLLTRQKSLNIRNIEADYRSHPHRDPGCRSDGHSFLRSFTKQYHHALIIFDLEGCGKNKKDEIENELEINLQNSGWGDRAVAIVIDPELEIWVWSNSKQVDKVLEWKDKSISLRDWLRKEDFLSNKQIKPARPKEALEAVLKKVDKKKSSSLYQDLAEQVSLKGCSDDAFNKLIRTLQKWFPASKAKSPHP